MYLMNFAEAITDVPIPRDINAHTLSARGQSLIPSLELLWWLRRKVESGRSAKSGRKGTKIALTGNSSRLIFYFLLHITRGDVLSENCPSPTLDIVEKTDW